MRIFLLRHTYVTVLAAIAAAAAIFLAVTVPTAISASATERQLPIYCVHRDQKVCAISFDAAWGDASTADLVGILNRYGVKATFFVIGDWAEQYPQDVKMLHANGMEVMNHSSSHGHMNQMSAEEIIADVEQCNDQIEDITGQRPTLIRCPYGEYDDQVISAIRSIGMEPIQWDVDSLDWKDLSADEIYRRVTGKVQSGSIILFHNAGQNTPQALPDILEYLLGEGYAIVPVSEILLEGEYTIDHEGRQWPAEDGGEETDAPLAQ